MVDTFGTTGFIVLAILALIAIYIIMRLLGKPAVEEDEDGESEEEEEEEPAPPEEKPAEMSDEEFIESYTGPMMEDALDSLETAVDSAKAGLDFYRRSVWEAAGEEFHSAVKGIDDASGRLKEVAAMVEDSGSAPARDAKARLEECRRLRSLAITMEEACDARVYGKEAEAKRLEAVMPALDDVVAAFKK